MPREHEKEWQDAKNIVKKQRGKGEKEMTDKDWGLTQHIYQQKTGAVGSGEEVFCKEILGILEVQYLFYQSAHWQTQGPEFYGDHLMFQRLYDGVKEEIDSLAEKLVGIYGVANGALSSRIAEMAKVIGKVSANETMVVETGLLLEEALQLMLESMQLVSLPVGLDNLLATIADNHEGHQYLLKQRNSQ